MFIFRFHKKKAPRFFADKIFIYQQKLNNYQQKNNNYQQTQNIYQQKQNNYHQTKKPVFILFLWKIHLLTIRFFLNHRVDLGFMNMVIYQYVFSVCDILLARQRSFPTLRKIEYTVTCIDKSHRMCLFLNSRF